MATALPLNSSSLGRRRLRRRQPIATVLVLGETGTGKVVDCPRHSQYERAQGTPVRNAELRGKPFDLLESELFGHEKGCLHRGPLLKRSAVSKMADTGTLLSR